jgi:hypothetical protein
VLLSVPFQLVFPSDNFEALANDAILSPPSPFRMILEIYRQLTAFILLLSPPFHMILGKKIT